MGFYVSQIFFFNRAPFDQLIAEFQKGEIAVLIAGNGRGKTTIVSHIVDALYEIARPHFEAEFAGRENKLYRISSSLEQIDGSKASIFYIRFKDDDGIPYDYINIRGKCSQADYDALPLPVDRIPYQSFGKTLSEDSFIKTVSSKVDRKIVRSLFKENILTYFPAYRFETPGYLNDPYKVRPKFKVESGHAGYLPNPIEVVSGLPSLIDWLLDVVLDIRDKKPEALELLNNVNVVLNAALLSKDSGVVRFGVGPRTSGSSRVQVVRAESGGRLYPSVYNLSSGEAAMLALFGEIIRQADTIGRSSDLEKLSGIVLIDEIDKHLHIKLQKEALPALLLAFPNIQFIVTSHSPFLSMGLAEPKNSRAKVVDLDNLGITQDPTTCQLYNDVYEMMINENSRFKDLYTSLNNVVQNTSLPLIVTEGPTDVSLISAARKRLNPGLDFSIFEIKEDWGDSKLKALLTQLAKVPQKTAVVGVFDRDVPAIVKEIESDDQLVKSYGNNVFAICIPVPKGREKHDNVSIEFYFSDEELKTTHEGRRLHFTNEVVKQIPCSPPKTPKLVRLDAADATAELSKKIFDEDIGSVDWALSKAAFAILVSEHPTFSQSFNFENFNLLFERLKLALGQRDG